MDRAKFYMEECNMVGHKMIDLDYQRLHPTLSLEQTASCIQSFRWSTSTPCAKFLSFPTRSASQKSFCSTVHFQVSGSRRSDNHSAMQGYMRRSLEAGM